MEIFSEISEIYFQRCLLEDHFLCLPEVLCKKVFLKISENSQTFQKVYKWSIGLK